MNAVRAIPRTARSSASAICRADEKRAAGSCASAFFIQASIAGESSRPHPRSAA